MKQIRNVIRISNAYYVGLPKEVLGRLRLFRGSRVLLSVEGTRVVLETDPRKLEKEALKWG